MKRNTYIVTCNGVVTGRTFAWNSARRMIEAQARARANAGAFVSHLIGSSSFRDESGGYCAGTRTWSTSQTLSEETIMLNFTDNVVRVSDIAERIDELREARDDWEGTLSWDADNAEDATELASLESLMDEMKGYGGDEQWNGDWYPAEIIADSCFAEYAKAMLEDCGTIPADMPSWVAIDWDQTAEAVQQDYTSVDFDGNTFWYR